MFFSFISYFHFPSFGGGFIFSFCFWHYLFYCLNNLQKNKTNKIECTTKKIKHPTTWVGHRGNLHKTIREALRKKKYVQLFHRWVPEKENGSCTSFPIRHIVRLFLGAVAAMGRLKLSILRRVSAGVRSLGPFWEGAKRSLRPALYGQSWP
jgi:hypothetical protein